MIKYKYILYLDGAKIMDSYDDDWELYDDYDSAVDAALYSIGCWHVGGETLQLSNPGDYDYDPNEEPTYEIEEVEVEQ